MSNDLTAVARRHVLAVSTMLLGKRPLKQGLTMSGGELLDVHGQLRLAQMAKASQHDLIHLGFQETDNGFALADITLFLPRDFACHIRTDCQLWQGGAGQRARILPADEARGQYRVIADEVIHLDTKPAAMAEGRVRARKRLSSLVEQGCGGAANLELHELRAA